MIKIGDKEFRNLEEQVGFLSTRMQLAMLGLSLVDIVPDESSLPQAAEERQVYAVGANPPYTYYVYLSGTYSSLGVFPLAGTPGVPGDEGKQGPIGPQGPQGKQGPQGIAGPAGKGIGVDKITAIDLAVGEAAVTYDGTDGATIIKQGEVTAGGTTYKVDVEDEIPIIPGNNVTIDASEDGKHIVISAAGGGSSIPMEIITIGAGNSGTVSTENMAKLATSSVLCAVKSNNEIFWRMDDQHTPGSMGYSHLGYENGKFIQKNITFTITTNSWVKTTKDATTINGKSGAINLIAGNNVTISESGNDITINATGGGSGGTDSGFDNLSALALTPTSYQGAESPAGKFTFKGAGTYQLKGETVSNTLSDITIQLPVAPGSNVNFTRGSDGTCYINAESSSPEIIELNTNAATQFTNNYGRTYYTWSALSQENITKILNNDVTVRIYDQTSGGGYYYCDLAGKAGEQRFFGEVQPFLTTTPNSVLGWTVKGKESETAFSFWRDEILLSGGGSAAIYQHTLTLQYTSTDTYAVYVNIINSFGSKMSLTNYLNIYGTGPLIGYWYAFKVSTGRPSTSIVKIAATSTGFVLTDSGLNEKEGTLVSDTFVEV